MKTKKIINEKQKQNKNETADLSPNISMHVSCRLKNYFHQVMSDSFATPRTIACQAPLSVGFSRQEY